MSRRLHLIYQDLADPIKPTPAAETITIDKWFQKQPNPILRKTLQAAVIAGAFFFVNTESLVAGTQVPTWHPETNQGQRPFKYLPRQHTGEFRYELPREILVTDWFQPAQQPYFSKARNYFTGESRFEVPREIVLTDWYQRASEPYFTKLRKYFTGEFRFELPREILLTDWIGNLPSFIIRTRPVRHDGETRVDVITPAETVTIDKWYQPTSEPIRIKIRSVHDRETRTEETLPVYIDGIVLDTIETRHTIVKVIADGHTITLVLNSGHTITKEIL